MEQNGMILQIITDIFDELTPVERIIADFFLGLPDTDDYSAKTVKDELHISEASLSRFAQKCGFKGYREFVFSYTAQTHPLGIVNLNRQAQQVGLMYKIILEKSLSLANDVQMNRLSLLLAGSRKIFIHGIGSSGMTALEFKMRLMRIGLVVEAITDPHIMRMNSSLLDDECLILVLSVSGRTKEILSSMKIAKSHNARVIIVTSRKSWSNDMYFDELLPIASVKKLEEGTKISPQFPLLVMLDIFYAYFLETNYYKATSLHAKTLSALVNPMPST